MLPYVIRISLEDTNRQSYSRCHCLLHCLLGQVWSHDPVPSLSLPLVFLGEAKLL